MTTKFTTKAEYLAWTTKWKADYAALSGHIREYKAARKVGTIYERSQAQSCVHVARSQARAMLAERKEAKALSWQMKLAALAPK